MSDFGVHTFALCSDSTQPWSILSDQSRCRSVWPTENSERKPPNSRWSLTWWEKETSKAQKSWSYRRGVGFKALPVEHNEQTFSLCLCIETTCTQTNAFNGALFKYVFGFAIKDNSGSALNVIWPQICRNETGSLISPRRFRLSGSFWVFRFCVREASLFIRGFRPS